jgi:sodium/potassium-transporting ATPase subunit alpha
MRRIVWLQQKTPSRRKRWWTFHPQTVRSGVARLTVVVLFIKGAPDVLLPRCTSVLLPTGEITPLTQDLSDELTALQSRWSSGGQRVLLLARRVISNSEVDVKAFDSPEMANYILREKTENLVAVGMIGIVDPPRPDIPEVVRICRGGGIRFFMVTHQLFLLTKGYR